MNVLFNNTPQCLLYHIPFMDYDGFMWYLWVYEGKDCGDENPLTEVLI